MTTFQFLLFHFSHLALCFQFHIPASVSSFPFLIYCTISVFLLSLSSLVKLSRSPSDCQDPVWSKINPLPLPQLHSNHPPRLQHYANQAPKLWPAPETSDALSSCSNYRVEIDAVGIKNLEDLTNRNSSVTVRTLIYWQYLIETLIQLINTMREKKQ